VLSFAQQEEKRRFGGLSFAQKEEKRRGGHTWCGGFSSPAKGTWAAGRVAAAAVALVAAHAR
jgi:hypothetical protein